MTKEKEKNTDLITSVINPSNLALLRKSDRLVVIIGGLIVVAALGGTATLRDEPYIALTLTISSIVIIAGLAVFVYFRSQSLGELEADLQVQSAAAQAVNGEWWQLVRTRDHPGLAYVTISISQVAEQHAIQGIVFNERGERVARFSSDAVAIKSTTPVELYYFWRGTVYGSEDASIFSGLGRIRFDSLGYERQPFGAEGAFTRGTSEELTFADARAIELIRLSKKESEQLAEDRSLVGLGELAAQAFSHFGLEPGRMFSETNR